MRLEIQRIVTNAIVHHFSISHELWNRSAEFYCSNETLAPQLHCIVSIFPYRQMLIKNERYNELKKSEMFTVLLDIAKSKENILVQMLEKFKNGTLLPESVPKVFDA